MLRETLTRGSKLTGLRAELLLPLRSLRAEALSLLGAHLLTALRTELSLILRTWCESTLGSETLRRTKLLPLGAALEFRRVVILIVWAGLRALWTELLTLRCKAFLRTKLTTRGAIEALSLWT